MTIQYCFKILDKSNNIAKLKLFLAKQYESDLKFIIIYAKTDNVLCIEFSTRSKKIIEKIKKLHTKESFLKSTGKKLGKPELFDETQKAWWGSTCKSDDKKWTTLKHNGPYFHEPYEKINAVVKI